MVGLQVKPNYPGRSSHVSSPFLCPFLYSCVRAPSPQRKTEMVAIGSDGLIAWVPDYLARGGWAIAMSWCLKYWRAGEPHLFAPSS